MLGFFGGSEIGGWEVVMRKACECERMGGGHGVVSCRSRRS